MNFLLGSRGRLARAISSSTLLGDITVLDRSAYADWSRPGAADGISRFFERITNAGGIVYIAAGLIDPRQPQEDHHRINFILPKNVIEGASRVGLRAVTFGTVMENAIANKSRNPYYSSKKELANFVAEFSSRTELVLHIRMHTLYGGGPPAPFMFLGQILHSIERRAEFYMSSGLQLREYHHVDDDVAAILKFTSSRMKGIVELSHGAPVMLKDLATFVFESFDCLELLKVGALATPPEENYEIVFERSPQLGELKFRNSLSSIVEFLQACRPSSQ